MRAGQTETGKPGGLTRRGLLGALAAVPLLEVTAAFGPAAARASAEPAEEIRRGNPNRQMVALTFDAGADRGYAELILDVLYQNNVPASFGMTGLWASKNRELVKRMADDGHEFINHTWDHESWTGLSTRKRPLSYEERRVEIVRTEEILAEIAGVDPKPYFRSPYGDTNAGVLADLGSFGYRYNVLWTVDSRGWLGIPADEIVRICLTRAAPGAIYVCHVGAQSQDGPALQRIVTGLRESGYDFGTLTMTLAP